MKVKFVMITVLALLLAACGQATEVTYACEGTSEDVTVFYDDTEEAVSLPWEHTTTKRGNFDANLRAENNTVPLGEISCAVLLDGREVAATGGRGGADIEVAVSGSEVNASSLGLDADIPTEGVPIAFTVSNEYTEPLCAFFIRPIEDDSWQSNRLEATLEVGDTVTIDGIETIEYDYAAYNCDGDLIAIDKIFTLEIDELTFADAMDKPAVTVQNNTSLALCSLQIIRGPVRGDILLEELEPGATFTYYYEEGQLSLGATACDGGGQALLTETLSADGYAWEITDSDLE